MQNTAHIIEFYSHKALEALRRGSVRDMAPFTRAHDAYLIEHDKAVSRYVALLHNLPGPDPANCECGRHCRAEVCDDGR